MMTMLKKIVTADPHILPSCAPPVESTLCILIHRMLTTPTWGSYYIIPILQKRKNEAQRGKQLAQGHKDKEGLRVGIRNHADWFPGAALNHGVYHLIVLSHCMRN